MIRCKDQKIIFFQLFQQYPEIFVEFFNLMAITFCISSVAPECIKVNQIDKAQSMKILLTDFDGLFHSVDRAGRMIGFCDSFSAEDIIDLTYTDHIQAFVLHSI